MTHTSISWYTDLVCWYLSHNSLLLILNGILLTYHLLSCFLFSTLLRSNMLKIILQVGGDSCIFVWRLPTQLSSMMSQKIIEHAASPSQICSFQLAVPSEGDILHEEICHQLTTKMKDISELGHFSQDGEQVLIEEGAHKESSAFKFSISRLPKWAQNHVTREETVCLYPESNLSQVIC